MFQIIEFSSLKIRYNNWSSSDNDNIAEHFRVSAEELNASKQRFKVFKSNIWRTAKEEIARVS